MKCSESLGRSITPSRSRKSFEFHPSTTKFVAFHAVNSILHLFLLTYSNAAVNLPPTTTISTTRNNLPITHQRINLTTPRPSGLLAPFEVHSTALLVICIAVAGGGRLIQYLITTSGYPSGWLDIDLPKNRLENCLPAVSCATVRGISRTQPEFKLWETLFLLFTVPPTRCVEVWS